MATVDTENYSIGMPDVYFCNTATVEGTGTVTPTTALLDLASILNAVGTDSSTEERALYSLGNLPEASIAPEYSTLDHYISDKGTRKKDKEIVTEKNLAITLSSDEFSIENIQRFLMADTDGTASELMGSVAPEGSAVLVYDSDYGNPFLLAIPRCTLTSEGELAFASEDWMASGITLSVLSLSGFDATTLDLNAGINPPDGVTDAPYGYIQSEKDFGDFYSTTA